MYLTATQLENLANQTFDFYIKDKVLGQSIQARPLVRILREKQKVFPGGKEFIHGNVQFDYEGGFEGYEGDDEVHYDNPAGVKQFSFPWKELHDGIQVTHSELKKAGITIVDSAFGDTVAQNSRQDVIRITQLFENKLNTMRERQEQSFNRICWLDGTQDSKVFPGLLSILTDDATTGVVGGIDRAAQSLWRHRTAVGASALEVNKVNQTLTSYLRNELRQLNRYGGKPNRALCGSTFMEALEYEIEQKGVYTDAGFTKQGATELGMNKVTMRGLGTFEYDPTLDDLGYEKRCYIFDDNHIQLWVMDGQDMKKHTPARPAERYVLYRGVTWTGGMIADMLNCNAVYEVQAKTSWVGNPES